VETGIHLVVVVGSHIGLGSGSGSGSGSDHMEVVDHVESLLGLVVRMMEPGEVDYKVTEREDIVIVVHKEAVARHIEEEEVRRNLLAEAIGPRTVGEDIGCMGRSL